MRWLLWLLSVLVAFGIGYLGGQQGREFGVLEGTPNLKSTAGNEESRHFEQGAQGNEGTKEAPSHPTPAPAPASAALVPAGGCPLPTDANSFFAAMHHLCQFVNKDPRSSEARSLAVPVFMFCMAHAAQFKRGHTYELDNVNATEGYYRGIDTPPYQMHMFQYNIIAAIVSAIPHRTVKMALEEKGKGFIDTSPNYQNHRRGPAGNWGSEGPRVLFWGCGFDTPMHALLVEHLGGHITFLDDNEGWAGACVKLGGTDTRIITTLGNLSSHYGSLSKMALDGSELDTDLVEDKLTAGEWPANMSGLDKDEPWDVIVIDGPSEVNQYSPGRSMPLYMAKRLAQSYQPNHYTNIFLHDSARKSAILWANVVMGHDPSEYIGNVLPRKGLKYWRVAGRRRKFPATQRRI